MTTTVYPTRRSTLAVSVNPTQGDRVIINSLKAGRLANVKIAYTRRGGRKIVASTSRGSLSEINKASNVARQAAANKAAIAAQKIEAERNIQVSKGVNKETVNKMASIFDPYAKENRTGWRSVVGTFTQLGRNVISGDWLQGADLPIKNKFLKDTVKTFTSPLSIFTLPAGVAAGKVLASSALAMGTKGAVNLGAKKAAQTAATSTSSFTLPTWLKPATGLAIKAGLGAAGIATLFNIGRTTNQRIEQGGLGNAFSGEPLSGQDLNPQAPNGLANFSGADGQSYYVNPDGQVVYVPYGTGGSSSYDTGNETPFLSKFIDDKFLWGGLAVLAAAVIIPAMQKR